MSSVWVVSDTHFGDVDICHAIRNDGVTKLRPWQDPEKMDEEMIQRWNDRVRPGDQVYHLGDVVTDRRYLPVLARLNGDKVLIRGKHDIFHDNEYRQYFCDIRAYHITDRMILSHAPVHPSKLGRYNINIHGYLHDNRVMRYVPGPNWTAELCIDSRYYCVCVEQTNFAPILIEDVLAQIATE